MVELSIVGLFVSYFCFVSYCCFVILVSARLALAGLKDMPGVYLFPWFYGEWQTLEDFIILNSLFWTYLGILFRFTAFRVSSQLSPGPAGWFQTIRRV
jgi:hypothetical protein